MTAHLRQASLSGGTAIPLTAKKRKHPNRMSETMKLWMQLDELVGTFVKERDNWTCVRPGCGRSREQGYRIEAAHILSKGRYSKVRFLPENIMALCHRCHREWHDQSTGAAWLEEKYFGLRDDLLVKDKLAAKPDVKLLLSLWQNEQFVAGQRHG